MGSLAIAMVIALTSSANGVTIAPEAWRPVSIDKDRTVFVDQSRIEKRGAAVTAWSMSVMASPPQTSVGTVGYYLLHAEYDCAAGSHRPLSLSAYSASGRMLAKDEHLARSEEVPKNTVGFYIMRAACNGEFARDDTFQSTLSAATFAAQQMGWLASPDSHVESATDEMKRQPPPPEVAYLKLPTGRLAGLGGDDHSAAFIDMDHVERQGDTVSTIIYGVLDPGKPVGDHLETQAVMGVRFDCGQQTNEELGVLAYDANDTLLMWVPPARHHQHTEPQSAYGVAASMVCSGGPATSDLTANGHTEAYGDAKALIASRAPGSANPHSP